MARMSVADRRAALILAALRVIERDGVHGATTRAIVAEAGMPLASFHYAFLSRDELIRELIRTVVETEGQAASETLSEQAGIRTSIRDGLQAYFDLLVAEPNREQAMFELLHYSLRTEELHDLPKAQYSTYWKTAASVLEVGAKAARVQWKLPVAEVARLLVTFISGLTLAWLADRDAEAAARTMDFAADSLAVLAEPISDLADAKTNQSIER
ncbi:MAG: TetR family transcriptional regulator [Microbacteriaceae bacterium]|nr:TetR family transcriptional regulator [Cryobacterium sp.]MCC6376552.1 TetR family transcriptional regulator [Microbacteriaceae bacterium]